MKKKYVLKRWVKVVLWSMLGILWLVLFYFAFRVIPEDLERIQYCVDQGYSKVSCEKGYFGY